MLKNKLIVGAFCFISLSLLLVFSLNLDNKNEENISSEEPSEVPVTESHANSIADFSDPQLLLGASTHAFVGKVVEKVGSKALGNSPETQFAVKIQKSIKGDLKGEVIVNQQGGYYKDKNGKEFLLVVNNDELLEVGEKYFFATRYLESENWYTAISVFGDVKIKNKTHEDNLVVKYKNAFKNEKIPEALKNAGPISREEREKLNQKDEKMSKEQQDKND